MSLFETSSGKQRASAFSPLAERMRPENLEDFVGQVHLLGEGKPLRRQVERGDLTSLILWGPPGSGKTTLAGIIAHRVRCDFVRLKRRAFRHSRDQADHGRRRTRPHLRPPHDPLH